MRLRSCARRRAAGASSLQPHALRGRARALLAPLQRTAVDVWLAVLVAVAESVAVADALAVAVADAVCASARASSAHASTARQAPSRARSRRGARGAPPRACAAAMAREARKLPRARA